MRRKPIYVESIVHGSMDELWSKTQTPELHKRWDLRFTDIEYLPRESEDSPQLFLYATRIGFGLRIDGKGETVGSADAADGSRTSALKFWSDDPKSLISTGSGYWKYVPSADGIRFLTLYDYDTRFGALGALLDRFLFRPIMGWATAWSFDCLRQWIEKSVSPEISIRQSCIHLLARCGVAFVLFYHGLVPKWLYHQPDELLPLLRLGISPGNASALMQVAGALEMLLAAGTLILWKRAWPLILTAAGMVVALLGVASTAPELLVKAFNVVSTNVMLFLLAVIAIISMKGLPSASKCLRKPPEPEKQ